METKIVWIRSENHYSAAGVVNASGPPARADSLGWTSRSLSLTTIRNRITGAASFKDERAALVAWPKGSGTSTGRVE